MTDRRTDRTDDIDGGIIRVRKRTDRYSIVDNEPFNDERLSYGARGVMAYLLTKPDDWEVRMSDLINSTPDGRDGVRSFVRELQDAGYMRRERVRAAGGRFRWITEVYETPKLITQKDEQILMELSKPKPEQEAPAEVAPKARKTSSDGRRSTERAKPTGRPAPGPYAALKAAYMQSVESRGLNTKMTEAARYLEELSELQTTAEEIEAAVDHATNGWRPGAYFAIERLPSAVRSLRAIRSKQTSIEDPREAPDWNYIDRDEQLARVDEFTRQQYATLRAAS